MKKLLLTGLFALAATSSAFAQDFDRRDRDGDRGFRHEERFDRDRDGDRRDNPGRAVGRAFRAIEGRSTYERRCRVEIVRRHRPDGDVVVTRRRICR